MSIEKHHAEAWARYIMDAGATADIAARAVELATLNGLFDIHRDLETTRRLAKNLNVSDAALGMRLRNEAHDA